MSAARPESAYPSTGLGRPSVVYSWLPGTIERPIVGNHYVLT
jgi:hypothetical protein